MSSNEDDKNNMLFTASNLSLLLNFVGLINPIRYSKLNLLDSSLAIVKGNHDNIVLIKVIPDQTCPVNEIRIPESLRLSLQSKAGDVIALVPYEQIEYCTALQVEPQFDTNGRNYSKEIIDYMSSDSHPVSIGSFFMIFNNNQKLTFKVTNSLPGDRCIANRATKVYQINPASPIYFTPFYPTKFSELSLDKSIYEQIKKYICFPLQQTNLIQISKSPTPNGVLIIGKSGSGKTSLITAISNSLGFPSIIVDVERLIILPEKDALDILKKCFSFPVGKPSSLIIFDDIDLLFEKIRNMPYKRIAAFFIAFVDRLLPNKNTVIIATAKSTENLASYITRYGRFGFHIKLGELTQKQRVDIIKSNTAGFNSFIQNDKDIEFIANNIKSSPFYSTISPSVSSSPSGNLLNNKVDDIITPGTVIKFCETAISNLFKQKGSKKNDVGIASILNSELTMEYFGLQRPPEKPPETKIVKEKENEKKAETETKKKSQKESKINTTENKENEANKEKSNNKKENKTENKVNEEKDKSKEKQSPDTEQNKEKDEKVEQEEQKNDKEEIKNEQQPQNEKKAEPSSSTDTNENETQKEDDKKEEKEETKQQEENKEEEPKEEQEELKDNLEQEKAAENQKEQVKQADTKEEEKAVEQQKEKNNEVQVVNKMKEQAKQQEEEEESKEEEKPIKKQKKQTKKEDNEEEEKEEEKPIKKQKKQTKKDDEEEEKEEEKPIIKQKKQTKKEDDDEEEKPIKKQKKQVVKQEEEEEEQEVKPAKKPKKPVKQQQNDEEEEEEVNEKQAKKSKKPAKQEVEEKPVKKQKKQIAKQQEEEEEEDQEEKPTKKKPTKKPKKQPIQQQQQEEEEEQEEKPAKKPKKPLKQQHKDEEEEEEVKEKPAKKTKKPLKQQQKDEEEEEEVKEKPVKKPKKPIKQQKQEENNDEEEEEKTVTKKKKQTKQQQQNEEEEEQEEKIIQKPKKLVKSETEEKPAKKSKKPAKPKEENEEEEEEKPKEEFKPIQKKPKKPVKKAEEEEEQKEEPKPAKKNPIKQETKPIAPPPPVITFPQPQQQQDDEYSYEEEEEKEPVQFQKPQKQAKVQQDELLIMDAIPAKQPQKQQQQNQDQLAQFLIDMESIPAAKKQPFEDPFKNRVVNQPNNESITSQASTDSVPPKRKKQRPFEDPFAGQDEEDKMKDQARNAKPSSRMNLLQIAASLRNELSSDSYSEGEDSKSKKKDKKKAKSKPKPKENSEKQPTTSNLEKNISSAASNKPPPNQPISKKNSPFASKKTKVDDYSDYDSDNGSNVNKTAKMPKEEFVSKKLNDNPNNSPFARPIKKATTNDEYSSDGYENEASYKPKKASQSAKNDPFSQADRNIQTNPSQTNKKKKKKKQPQPQPQQQQQQQQNEPNLDLLDITSSQPNMVSNSPQQNLSQEFLDELLLSLPQSKNQQQVSQSQPQILVQNQPQLAMPQRKKPQQESPSQQEREKARSRNEQFASNQQTSFVSVPSKKSASKKLAFEDNEYDYASDYENEEGTKGTKSKNKPFEARPKPKQQKKKQQQPEFASFGQTPLPQQPQQQQADILSFNQQNQQQQQQRYANDLLEAFTTPQPSQQVQQPTVNQNAVKMQQAKPQSSSNDIKSIKNVTPAFFHVGDAPKGVIVRRAKFEDVDFDEDDTMSSSEILSVSQSSATQSKPRFQLPTVQQQPQMQQQPVHHRSKKRKHSSEGFNDEAGNESVHSDDSDNESETTQSKRGSAPFARHPSSSSKKGKSRRTNDGFNANLLDQPQPQQQQQQLQQQGSNVSDDLLSLQIPPQGDNLFGSMEAMYRNDPFGPGKTISAQFGSADQIPTQEPMEMSRHGGFSSHDYSDDENESFQKVKKTKRKKSKRNDIFGQNNQQNDDDLLNI